MRLLIATRNPGKLAEIKALLSDLPFECVSLDEVGVAQDVAETGDSFRDNAILKAQSYAQMSGLATLADDSGLEVDALGGEPGVRSARWAGPQASDMDRIRLLQERLRGVAAEARTAQFRCVAAAATLDGRLFTGEGIVRGVIISEPRGAHGFGYDPVFLLPELGRTLAELPKQAKNRISHRARAIETLRPALATLAAEEKEGTPRAH